MKSLYFQTVGIECKLYENQQLEYRLYSWGQSVFEKLFLHNCTHISRYSFVRTVVSPFRRLFLLTYIVAEYCFNQDSIMCYDIDNRVFPERLLNINTQKRRHAYDLEITLAVSHLFLRRMGA